MLPWLTSTDIIRDGISQQFAREFDAFTRNVVWRTLPLFGVRRFVTEIPGVALLSQQAEHFAPFHDAFTGWQPISRSPHAGDGGGRQIAVLEAVDLFRRYGFEAAASRATPREVIGIDQVAAVRLVRAFDQFGQNGKTVQHVVLRIEFDREFKFIIRSEIAGVLEIFDGVFDGSVDLARRAHQRVAAKRHRVLARFTKNLEKALAFLAGGEQPTVFNPKNAAGNATLFDQVQHLLIAHAGIETSLEIG